MGSAPASSISRRTDQIHRPVLDSAFRTLPLSAGRAGARDWVYAPATAIRI